MTWRWHGWNAPVRMYTVRRGAARMKTWAESHKKTYQLEQAHDRLPHTGSRKMEQWRLEIAQQNYYTDTDNIITLRKIRGNRKEKVKYETMGMSLRELSRAAEDWTLWASLVHRVTRSYKSVFQLLVLSSTCKKLRSWHFVLIRRYIDWKNLLRPIREGRTQSRPLPPRWEW